MAENSPRKPPELMTMEQVLVCQQIVLWNKENMGVVRINGDPICVVAMSPTGRQNLTIVIVTIVMMV